MGGEDGGWCRPSKSLSGSVVQSIFNLEEPALGVDGEVGSLGEVWRSRQLVSRWRRAAKARWISEVDAVGEQTGHPTVAGHLSALLQGQGEPQRSREAEQDLGEGQVNAVGISRRAGAPSGCGGCGARRASRWPSGCHAQR
jgi:hypothetical protein